MTVFSKNDLIAHPVLAGVWRVTHDQPLPHRHVNVEQGSNTAQITADHAVRVRDVR